MTDDTLPAIKTLQDLRNLVEGGAGESLYLEFKASEALSGENIAEICKDVSAFANAAGGQLIYGIGGSITSCAEFSRPCKAFGSIKFQSQTTTQLSYSAFRKLKQAPIRQPTTSTTSALTFTSNQ